MIQHVIRLFPRQSRYLRKRVREGGYKSESELVGKSMARSWKLSEDEFLQAQLEAGLASGPSVPADEKFWRELREGISRRRTKPTEFTLHLPEDQSEFLVRRARRFELSGEEQVIDTLLERDRLDNWDFPKTAHLWGEEKEKGEEVPKKRSPKAAKGRGGR